MYFMKCSHTLSTIQTQRKKKKQQLFRLGHAYCFISQTMLLRSNLKSEVDQQTNGLKWLRNSLKEYGLTAKTLKEAEDISFNNGHIFSLKGLGEILQRVCPLCSEQWVRDARGPKK